MQKISGTAALLILAALLHGPDDLAALGEHIGVSRYQTLREAAQEAVAAEYGLLLPTPGRRLRFAPSATLASLLHPGLATLVFPSADAEGGSRAWRDSKEINKEIDTSIYRTSHFAAAEGSSAETDQIRAEGQNQAAINIKTESVLNEQKVFTNKREVNRKCSLETESVLNEQKVFVSSPPTDEDKQTESVRKEQKVFVSSSEPEKQAPDFSPDYFLAVEAADALPRGKQPSPNDAAYVTRQQAQVQALLGLWREQLPTKPVTDRSLAVLLRAAEGEALRVAEMVLVCVERGIEHPFSYIQAALKRQALEREARNPRSSGYEYELQPMTDEFAQQLAQAAARAKELWGD